MSKSKKSSQPLPKSSAAQPTPQVPQNKVPTPAKPTQEKTNWFPSVAYRNALLAILAITLVVFIPSLFNDFTNWDDPDYVLDNRFVVQLTWENIKTYFMAGIAPAEYGYPRSLVSNYHPLTMLSLGINYAMTGRNASSYHATNLLLHLIDTALVFALIYRLSGRKWQGAAFAALLFGIHPMHVESVAWVAERKDVLYGLFFIWALITYHRYLEQGNRRQLIYTFVLFLLSLLSKPTAVMLPIVLLLMDYYHHRKITLNTLLEKVPFFIFSVILGLITINIQREEAIGALSEFNIIHRICFASYGTVMYIAKAFVPIGLSTLYPYPKLLQGIPIPFMLAPLFALALAVGVWYSARYTRVIVFGVLFYLAMLALTLQFFAVGQAIMSDRYTYIAYIGLLVILAWFINEYIVTEGARFSQYQKMLVPAMGIAAIVYGGLAAKRCLIWKNSNTLWTDVIEKYPQTPTAHNNRGNYFNVTKDFEQAVLNFNNAITLDANYYEALVSRGMAYRQLNKLDLAIADLKKATDLRPNKPLAYVNRGNVYFSLRQNDLAVADYKKVVELDPHNPAGYGNLGAAYVQMGQHELGITQLDKALSMNPDYVDPYLNKGIAYALMQKHDLAIPQYTRYMQLVNDNPMVYLWRGLAYQNMQNHQQAINDFSTAIRMNPRGSAGFYDARAKSYDAIGNTAAAAQDRATLATFSK
jgi:tetratricopeptide (TPR) repeat protein